ncbi:MAG: FAD-dependent oxidoreductase, partial [Gammaproteobacteria bacterium]
ANTVGGGHAVKAGGFALVGTELQQKRGYADSPEIAVDDLMRWGETANAEWVKRYVTQSNTMVYEWLQEMGVEFKVIIDTPEATVPRFHFTAGTAVNAVVPMMQKAFASDRIRFVWNERAVELLVADNRVNGIKTLNERSGAAHLWQAPAVIMATGGFQNNLDMVRENWPATTRSPDNLLKCAGLFAQGDGYRMAAQAGASLKDLHKQVHFINGLPDPRDPTGSQALTVHNASSIWVNAQGMRFVNEAAPDKTTVPAVLQQKPTSMWMIFDQRGLKRLQIRGATWLDRDTMTREIITNPAVTHQANSPEELARLASLPPEMLRTTISRYNGFVGAEHDTDFDRFASTLRLPTDSSEPPFYAMQLHPLTRKSMGGPAVDSNAAVLDMNSDTIEGLYAAGELIGVAGINGDHGQSGTFLGPSVFTGRIAGRSAAGFVSTRITAAATNPPSEQSPPPINMSHEELQVMLTVHRSGYWHFEQVHTRVLERQLNCELCHSDTAPMVPALKPQHMAAQLQTCTLCH